MSSKYWIELLFHLRCHYTKNLIFRLIYISIRLSVRWLFNVLKVSCKIGNCIVGKTNSKLFIGLWANTSPGTNLHCVLQYIWGKIALLMRTFCISSTKQLSAHLTTFYCNFLLNKQTKRPHFFLICFSNCLYMQVQYGILYFGLWSGISGYCRIIEHVNQPIRRGQS